MSLEALLIPENLTDSDSDGIDGGTGCNFIFLLCRLLVVGPVLKWLPLFIFYVLMYFAVDSVLATLFDIFAQISFVGLLGLSNVHFRIRFLI